MKIVLIGIFLIGTGLTEPQLQLVNFVFRHGDRAPVLNAMFPTDPYINCTFHPMGHGGLTNDGKYRVYQLGKFLRDRYRDFLGDVYLPKILSARSTNYNRAKMSLQLVLSALFPPTGNQGWHSKLDWQPIPFVTVPENQDDILGVTFQSSFTAAKERVTKTEFIQKRLKSFEGFIAKLEILTGKKLTNTHAITQVYDTLYAEWKLNLTLPSWSAEMFPDGELLELLLIDDYDILTYDKNMTYELVGKLAAKIRDDILTVADKIQGVDTKIFLYSGHELNIVGAFASLHVHKRDVPTYASAAIIELYKENDRHYVKVLYYHGDTREAEEMKMPGCSILCPLEKYLNVVNELLSSE